MTSSLQVIGFLAFLVLWVAWCVALWKQPRLAIGVIIGVVAAGIAVLAIRAAQFEEIPIWLPALPFIVVALTLFAFSFLAWYWGREDNEVH